MFGSPKNILIAGGTFNSVRTARWEGISILQEAIAHGAFHNSSDRYDPPKCHPQTRLAVIQAIMEWIQHGQESESFIMWLYGPAGAGKSAIAQTIAEMCHRLGILAASFFWSRSSPGRNSERRLIASLTYQLVIAIPEIRIYVEQALENDPFLLQSRSLEAQMEALIVEPLEKTFPKHDHDGPINPINPKLIILDGLDECSTPKAQQYILKVISTAIRRFPIPLTFLIASRPEQEIRDAFNDKSLLSITARLALDDTYHPDDDIRLFLVNSFESLKKNHTLRSLLPSVWPTAKEVERLVRKSSGQFIYAATVVKFVSSPRHKPDNQLQIIFGIVNSGTLTPFAELDALYHHIFSKVQDLPRALEIMGCLFVTKNFSLAASVIESILFYKEGDLHLILSDLHSIVDVPDIADVRHDIRVFHASLQDFLMDPTRSKHFYIDESKSHAQLAQWILRRHETVETEIHEFVLSIFLSHCLKSFPTKELLGDLFNFDFEKWLPQDLESRPRNWMFLTQLLQLSAWLLKQESIVKEHFGAEVYHERRSLDVAIDGVSKVVLENSLDTEVGKNKNTALMHPLFFHSIDRPAMFEIIHYRRPKKFQIGDIHAVNLFSLHDDVADGEHILELQAFLGDCERAGPCFVDGAMYAALSLQILTFLAEQSQLVREQPEDARMYRPAVSKERTVRCAITSLPFYLSKAGYSLELSEYILAHWQDFNVETSYAYLKVFQNAIDQYIKTHRAKTPEPEPELEEPQQEPVETKKTAGFVNHRWRWYKTRWPCC